MKNQPKGFSIDHKSFELKEVGEGRKAQVFITERRRGRSSWIRFGREGVKILTKGVESFRRGVGRNNEGLEWRENERRYCLKLKENEGGRFILCSVADLDGRWHGLSFPEGNGLINGWSMLVEALQAMGPMEFKGEFSKPAKATSPSKREKKMEGLNHNLINAGTSIQEEETQDTLWLDISESISKGNLGVLKNGLVGGWKSQQIPEVSLIELEAWAKSAWRLKGSVLLQKLNQNLFFLNFELGEEAYWVMENGSRIFRGEAMHLEWWSPSIGCRGRMEEVHEVWIRVVGLPLHLWTTEILEKIGNACGGFIALDKDTEQRNDLRWARILVKKERTGKPSSANLLAGARSYELQIWWEIQPRVKEVYPRRCRNTDLVVVSSGEDEGTTRAQGRVDAEKSHFSRERQYDECEREVLNKSGKGGLSQCTKCEGSYKVGPIQSIGFQKSKGTRGRMEGDKQVTLWDFKKRNLCVSKKQEDKWENGRDKQVSLWDSKKRNLGHQTRKGDALIRSPKISTLVGQCPIRCRAQMEWPIEENASNDERGKRRGSDGVKKTGIAFEPSIGLQSVGLGQSPRLTALRSTDAFRQEDKKKHHAGLMGRRERGMARPNLAESQTSDTLGIEEEGDQRPRSTQDQGQREDNTSEGEECRKGRRTSMEVRRSQIEIKESYPHDSDRGLDLIPVDPKIGGEDDASSGGEKIQSLCPRHGGNYGRFSFEKGRKIKACWVPNFREGKSLASMPEDDEDDGMWPRLTSTAGRISSTQQVQEAIGSGQGSSMIRGLNSSKGSVMEAGRTQGKEVDSGRSIQTGPGPKSNITSSLEELGSSGPTWSEGEELGAGMSQGKQTRSSRQQKCFCSSGMEGTVNHNPENGETGEEDSQEKEGSNINRYDDNFYEKSPSALISAFGRPLLPGDISGLGGFNGEEDLEPLRAIAADGREWGTKSSCELIEEGEGLAGVAHRATEFQNESPKLRTYERWEKSCLAKFSDFLGFPTKGFEKEITKLLRDLVKAQKLDKGKECQTVSKSERELRKLEWTINYKGKEISREDGRDKGKLLLKLNED